MFLLDGRTVQVKTISLNQPLKTSNVLTDYGDYVQYWIEPHKTIVGVANAIYRHSEPMEVAVYIDHFERYIMLNSNEASYCNFSFINTGNTPIKIGVAVRYQVANMDIVQGDIKLDFLEV